VGIRYLNPQLGDVIDLTSEPFSLALALSENANVASLPFPKASVERWSVEIMASRRRTIVSLRLTNRL